MKKFIKNKVMPVVLIFVVFSAIFKFGQDKIFTKENLETADTKLEGIEIEFIDVGQGDCALITVENETRILIDGGDVKTQDSLTHYLKDKVDGEIDFVIASHPHADHIGGLDEVLNTYEVGEFIMPKIHDSDVPTTRVYEKLLDAIKRNGCKVKRATDNLVIYEEDDFKIRCLGPKSDNYTSLNDYSAIIKIEYGDFSAIFMGDAERVAEEELVSSNQDITADVLKVGHHGSYTATSYEFLDKVKPSYAIISAGIANEYGHPHNDTLIKLGDASCKVYRTDYNGNITVTSDKKAVCITTQKGD